MLKFASSDVESSGQCTPNLLPCRIHHDGPVGASARYWAPAFAKDGKPESYFRGRKLHGRKVKIPEGYSGVIVQDDGQKEAMEGNSEERREDANSTEEHDEETATLQEKGQFDEIMVWGHESVAEEDDTFVKGVNEWIIFAEAMHKPGQAEKR